MKTCINYDHCKKVRKARANGKDYMRNTYAESVSNPQFHIQLEQARRDGVRSDIIAAYERYLKRKAKRRKAKKVDHE